MSAASSSQSLLLGPSAEPVAQALEQLAVQRVIRRLWDRDASLWSRDPTAQESIRRRLGWLDIIRVMGQHLEEVRAVVREVQQAGFTRALVLGMGGSGLFPEVCRLTFGVSPRHPDLVVLDTTDPAAIRAQSRATPPAQQLLLIASKSGSTIEVASLAAYFREALRAAGQDPGAHCLVITDAGTPLEAQAKAWKCRRIFAHAPGAGAEVGGRFSAFTYFGLLPAALIGVDLDLLLARAEEMVQRCAPDRPIDENPAARLGAALGALAQAGRDKLTILCAPQLQGFGTWVEQLVAESTGKQGQGIIPIHGEPLRSPDGYGPDRLFVELQLAGQLDPALERQVQALAAAGHPAIRIRWQDRYDVAGEAVKWFIATTIAGRVLGVNPFDEPNVQESKDRTTALLERFASTGTLGDDEPPRVTTAEAAVYGASALPSGSLSACLAAFFQQRRPRDYVALLSFLPRTPALDRTLHDLRQRLGERLSAPTALQFGPRYLHSTGQLFKGGPDAGLFVLLTSDEREDLPIPGQPYTFGTLKRAQALGDFQAMQQKGRRILRVHLRGDPGQSIRHL